MTPHLVKPIEGEKTAFPADDFLEPNDLDFYGFGKLEHIAAAPPEESVEFVEETETVRETTAPSRPARAAAVESAPAVHHGHGGTPALDGDFGHLNP